MFCLVLFCFVVMPKFKHILFYFVLFLFCLVLLWCLNSNIFFVIFYYFTFVWSCFVVLPKFKHFLFYFILFSFILFYYFALCVSRVCLHIVSNYCVSKEPRKSQLICSLWISDSVFFTAYFQFNVICFVTIHTHTSSHSAVSPSMLKDTLRLICSQDGYCGDKGLFFSG